jgi:predicted nucleotidyltransferase
MNRHAMDIPEKKIAQFCRDHKISEFAVFGSILRDDFGPTSDVDVLVTFTDDCGYSLLDLAMIKEQLQAIFNREVDIVEKASLKNPFRKKEILDHMEVIYAA